MVHERSTRGAASRRRGALFGALVAVSVMSGSWTAASATAVPEASDQEGATPAASTPAPWTCETLPTILIYPPPPTIVVCHTPLGDARFQLPPGVDWPF